jgi:hypothetical protein
MSFERIDRVETHVAAADLSAKQYYIVKLSTTDTIDVTDTAAAAYGVLQDKPKSGEQGTVAVCGAGGISRVICDGSGTAIAVGDYIKAHTNGKGIKGATDKDRVIGRAREACTVADQLVAVDLAYARDLAA